MVKPEKPDWREQLSQAAQLHKLDISEPRNQKQTECRMGIPDCIDRNTVLVHTYLPRDTREALASSHKDSSFLIDNFALKLNKAARFEGERFTYCNYKEKENERIFEPASYFGDFDISLIAHRQKQNIEALGLHVSSLDAKIDWRLVVGLGNESVYETSMTLHHIYGIPYIPASAMKGVVRSWVITELFDNEIQAIKDVDFCDIFGCPKKIEGESSYYNEDRQGKFIFFDVYPLSKPNIKVDIMNPHYGDYYMYSQDHCDPVPPADYFSPIPVNFLTVEHTLFRFMFGLKNVDNQSVGKGVFSGKKLFDIVKTTFKEVLIKRGIGAKTAVGYGYMSKITEL